MTTQRGRSIRWIAISGLCAVSIGAGIVLKRSADVPSPMPAGSAAEDPGADRAASDEVRPVREAGPRHRVAPGGRLALDAAALAGAGPLVLALDLSDEARGEGSRVARVIAGDGSRRLETRASALPGSGAGLRLEVDTSFLSPGNYMIEIETVDAHPLRLRRYVLEIR